METQAMLEDLNEEIRLQNEADEPFSQHIVYAPTKSAQKQTEFQSNRETCRKMQSKQRDPARQT